MRVLVTGHQGFAGSRLTASLLGDGHEVCGFDIDAGNDVANAEQVDAAVREFRPDQVFHLAAIARPAQARQDPVTAWKVNAAAAVNVLEAVRQHAPEAAVLLCGTSDEYGCVPWEQVTEESLCEPHGPYGASKLAQTALGLSYAATYGLHVVVSRAWMHTGPGSPDTQAISSFAKKIVAVERDQAPDVVHGNLDTLVDLTDVRDVVRAYRLAIGCESGIYNVCLGERLPLWSVMNLLTDASVLGHVDLRLDPSFGKGLDMPHGSAEKLHQLTGWKPAIPLSQTLSDLLDYWRTR